MKPEYKRTIMRTKRRGVGPHEVRLLCLLECGHVRQMPNNGKLFVVGKKIICRDCEDRAQAEGG